MSETEKKPRKPKMPFEQRSLLQQEKTVLAACEFRLLKLEPESMRRVMQDLERSVADQIRRHQAAPATISPTESIGDL